MDDALNEIKKFHGHLGPYVVIGYKMGIIANKYLSPNPFSKTAKVWTKKQSTNVLRDRWNTA